MKKSILAVAVALAASLLHADLLYWQVSEQANITFDYAQLYYTTGSATTAADGRTVDLGGGYEPATMSDQLRAAELSSITDPISGFYVGFFSSSDKETPFNVSNWLSYNDVLSAMDKSWDGSKYVQSHTSVATFVPEPTSGLLLLLGLAGLAVRRKRA